MTLTSISVLTASRLLEHLVRDGKLELDSHTPASALASDLADAVDGAEDARDLAERAANWLEDQPGVAELYASDDEIAAALTVLAADD